MPRVRARRSSRRCPTTRCARCSPSRACHAAPDTLWSTSSALLADLVVTRQRGYAVDDEEDVEGVFCVGAAFFDHTGRCAGALSGTGIKTDLPAGRVEELGGAVRRYADRVTQQMGGRAPARD